MSNAIFCPECGDIISDGCLALDDEGNELPELNYTPCKCSVCETDEENDMQEDVSCEFDEDTRTVEQAWVDEVYRQSIDLLGQLQSLERVLLADLDDFTLDPDRASQAAKRMRKVVQDIRSMVIYTRLVNRS